MRQRSGGTEGEKRSAKRGSPRKRREDPLLSRGIVASGLNSSVRPRPLSETRPEDRFFFPRDCLFLPPRRATGIETELLPFLFSSLNERRVFRVCANFLKDLDHSPRESRLIAKIGDLRWTNLCIVFGSIIFKETKLSVRMNDVIN